jgi:hypothetical protein
MPLKRIPADEIEMMAAAMLPLLKRGETVRPFLRRNQERLLALVRDESWATLALVVNKIGITYSTGKPWTARALSHEFLHATAPLKGYGNRRKQHAVAANVSPIASASAPADSSPYRRPELGSASPHLASVPDITGSVAATPPAVPKFKPFSLKPSEPKRELRGRQEIVESSLAFS